MPDLDDPQLEARLVSSEEFTKHAAETTRIIVSTAGELRDVMKDLSAIMAERSKREFYRPVNRRVMG